VASRTASASAQARHIGALLHKLRSDATLPPVLAPQLDALTVAADRLERLLGGTGPPSIDASQSDTRHQMEEELRAEVQRLQKELAAAAAAPAAAAPAAAVEELQAVLPQYRAAAAQLQGRATVLKTQLSAAAAERDDLRAQAATWHDAAARHEAAYAQAAAKLATFEVQALSSSAAAQERSDQLAAEVARLRQRCAALEAGGKAAREEAARAQHALRAKAALAAAQLETIERLEGTVVEQQADIGAALNLVCDHSPALARAAGLGGGGGGEAAVLDFELDDARGAQAADEDAHHAPGCCCCAEHDGAAAWSIPAGGRAAADEWLHEPLGPGLGGKAALRAAAPSAPAGRTPLHDVAADIAALQQALRQALSDMP
jgi:hypothetical protein